MAGNHVNHGGRVLFLAHRRELLDQTRKTFRDAGIPQSGIEILSVQTAARRLGKIKEPTMIILDECFPAGTMIDGKAINQYHTGDTVLSLNHMTGEFEIRTIAHTFKHKPCTMLKITINGKEIACTDNHPFFTKRGYVPACRLTRDDEVLYLRNGDTNSNQASERPVQKKRKGLLLDCMFQGILPGNIIENDGGNQSEVCLGAYEGPQPNGIRGIQGKNAANVEAYWAQARQNHGERARLNESASDADRSAESTGYGCGACDPHRDAEGHRISDCLQGGHCLTGSEVGNRSGWEQSLLADTASGGPQEGRVLEWVRVEGLEVQEPTSDGTFGGLCPDGFVYNLEVSGNSNYFAEGVLVHNCHHAAAGTWRKVLDYYPNAWVVGLTATPCRMDGKGLGDIFQAMAQGVTTAELIRDGWLAPYRYIAPPSRIDLTTVKVVRGDYDQRAIADLVDRPQIVGDAVEHYRQYAAEKQAIVYCASIDHSQHTAEAFTAAGIRAAHIDGSTPEWQRDWIIKQFRDRKIMVLSNVDLLGEGFDVPACEACIMLRPTQSTALYIQQSMRCMRPGPGKTAIILDHVGNCAQHGFPDDDRDWSLDSAKRKPRAKAPLICPTCYAAYDAPPYQCPVCGAERPAQERDARTDPEQVGGKLAEITEEQREQARREKRQEEGMCRSYDDFMKLAIKRGFRTGWAWHKAKARGYI